MQLSNHKILITGGSRGIGFALAQKFVTLGNRVIIVGSNPKKLEDALSKLSGIEILQCNLSNDTEVQNLIATLRKHHQDISVLINNAGVQFNYSFLDDTVNPSLIQQEIDINLLAPIKLCQGLIPILSKHQESAIINVTSVLAFIPKEPAPVYCPTKAGLHSFTRILRYQLENTSIKVMELIPPLVDTDMTKGRGRDKISPEQLVNDFIRGYKNNKEEINIGKTKIARFLARWSPGIIEKKLRQG